jgi:ABC-type lipoprotein export system ATPase subunit
MISLENITKTYQLNELNIPVLKGINLHIAQYKFVIANWHRLST